MHYPRAKRRGMRSIVVSRSSAVPAQALTPVAYFLTLGAALLFCASAGSSLQAQEMPGESPWSLEGTVAAFDAMGAFPPPAAGRPSAQPLALRDSLVALVRAQIGTRYRFGGQTPERGFDCSGLVLYVSSLLDMPLPRTAAQQARVGEGIARDTSELLPGDLVTFGKGTVKHIGIYVGDNRFVHASPTAGRVIESPLVRPPAPRLPPWRGARRLFVTDAGDDAR